MYDSYEDWNILLATLSDTTGMYDKISSIEEEST